MKKWRLIPIFTLIIAGIVILILLFVKTQQKKDEKISRVIDAMSRGNSIATGATHANYFIANQTSEKIVVRRKTFTEDGRTRLDRDLIDPGQMVGIYTFTADKGGNVMPSNAFADLVILANNYSEDVIYFGVHDDDWINAFPSTQPDHAVYHLFIGPKREVISPEDCNKEYDNFGFQFTYPCTWNVRDESSEEQIIVESPLQWFVAHFPVENFEEHEERIKNNFDEYPHTKEAQIVIKGTTYFGTESSYHGGIDYEFNIDGNYVGVSAQRYLDEHNEALEMIFSSLKFVL